MSDGLDFDIRGNDTHFQATIGRVLKTLEGLKQQADSVGRAAKQMFIIGVGGFSIANFIKGAEEAEEITMKFRNALEANGAELDKWGDHLEGVANALSRVTTHGDEAIQTFMTGALNRGVMPQDLENMTKAAMGLSRVTGMGLNVSLRQLMMAQEGAFGPLQRFIPRLREAHDATEKLAIVNELCQKGWKQETAAMDTTKAAQDKLKDSLDDLKKSLGESLLPALKEFYQNATAIVYAIQDWVKAHKELVAPIVRWVSGLLTASVVVPIIIKAFMWLGGILTWLVTTPIGLLITGFLSLFAVMAYVTGEGDTFFARMKNGAMVMVGFLDHMFGSWNNFKETITAVWDLIWTNFKSGWEEAYHWLRTSTVGLQAWMETIWHNISFAIQEELYVWTYGFYDAINKLTKVGAIIGGPAGRAARDAFNLISAPQSPWTKDRPWTKLDEANRAKGISGPEDARHEAERARLELDKTMAQGRLNIQLLLSKLPGGDKLSGNVQKLLKDTGLDTVIGELTAAFKKLRESVINAEEAAPPEDLGLAAGAQKPFQASFVDAMSMYKGLASAAASTAEDPMKKLVDNSTKQKDLQQQQLEQTAAATKAFMDFLGNKLNEIGTKIGQKAAGAAQAAFGGA